MHTIADPFWSLFKNILQGDGFMDNRGPAGCLKSERFVDIMGLCGVATAVINCSPSGGYSDPTYQVCYWAKDGKDLEAFLRSVDSRHTVIFDEINRLPNDQLIQFSAAAK